MNQCIVLAPISMTACVDTNTCASSLSQHYYLGRSGLVEIPLDTSPYVFTLSEFIRVILHILYNSESALVLIVRCFKTTFLSNDRHSERRPCPSESCCFFFVFRAIIGYIKMSLARLYVLFKFSILFSQLASACLVGKNSHSIRCPSRRALG